MSDERQPQSKTKDVLIREAIANNPFLTNAEIARSVRTNQRQTVVFNIHVNALHIGARTAYVGSSKSDAVHHG